MASVDRESGMTEMGRAGYSGIEVAIANLEVEAC